MDELNQNPQIPGAQVPAPEEIDVTKPLVPKRRRRKSKQQIFKEKYLPFLILGVAGLLCLSFIFGSVSLRREQAAAKAHQERIAQLGQELTRDYAGKNPIIVGVLKGVVIFYSDMIRKIDVPCQMDFMCASSYGVGTETTGVVRIVKDTGGENPSWPSVSDPIEKEIEINTCDGMGFITPEMSVKWAESLNEGSEPLSGYNVRCAFLKGMVFTIDFKKFAEEIAHTYIIKDAWGDERDVREADVILTVSMLKLWNSYAGCDDYIKNCEENGYEFCIAKSAPHELRNVHTTNYQYLQDFSFTDEQVDELIEPTVTKIKDCLGLDWRKLILYMCGTGLDDKSVVYMDPMCKSIMANPELIKTVFTVKNCVNHFPIDAISQVSGISACEDVAYYVKTSKLVVQEREKFYDFLIEKGFFVTKSQTNFLFVKHPQISGDVLYKKVKEEELLETLRQELLNWEK